MGLQGVKGSRTTTAGIESVDRGVRREDGNRYGRPVDSFENELAAANVGVRGRIGAAPPTATRMVRTHLEGLIAERGRRLYSELPPNFRRCLDNAIGVYREAGCSELELAGLRYAVAIELTKALG